MSAKIHNFRIGLFVLAGMALLVAGLFAIGLKAYLGEHETFETYVTGKVENLSVGALVKLRGVTIGKVSSIELSNNEYPESKEQYVVIQFEVPKGAVWKAQAGSVQQELNAEIVKGLRARIQAQGFIGSSIVLLEYVDPETYPVEPVPWSPKHYYIPSAPSQFNHVLASIEKSLGHVENLDLADLLNRADKLIDNVNGLAGNVNQIDFKGLGTNATSLLVEFRDTTRDLQKTLSDARNAINGADLPGIRRDAGALLAKLSAAAVELRRVLASVDTGELNSSLANVRVATDDLITLIHDLEQRPSSLLFSKSPKPLSEMEKPPKK
jgi:phospholipid/cholesterol/gamma-HCH transport system substrate-binding protein